MRIPNTHTWRRHLLQIALVAISGAALASPGLASSEGGQRPKVDAWPLLEIDEDTTTVLYPLYSKEGDSITSFPFYYRTNGGRDHHVLWPMVKVSDGHLERVAPLYFSGEDQLTIFPLIHRTEQSTTLLFPPAHWRHDGDFFALLPFYARSGDHRFYAPSIFVEVKDKHGDKHGDKGERRIERIHAVPLFNYEQRSGRQRKKLNILFLSRNQWGEDWREIKLLPMGAVRSGTADDYVWIGPYYQDDEVRMVAPLYYENETAHEHDRWILTWREQRSNDRQISAVYPFYSDTHDTIHGNRKRRTLSALWPVYHREEILSDAGDRDSMKRRFLMFSDVRSADGTRRFELFGLPVSETVEERSPARRAPAKLDTGRGGAAGSGAA
jgi:hypothetical protein